MKFTKEEFASLVRYIVESEKAKRYHPDGIGWKIPAIKALRSIKSIGLLESKNLVESVDLPVDPVIFTLEKHFPEWD